MARSGHQTFSTDRRINDIAKDLLRDGWRIKARKKHTRLESPDGTKHVTVPSSPGDHRTALNFVSQLRRLGVIK